MKKEFIKILLFIITFSVGLFLYSKFFEAKKETKFVEKVVEKFSYKESKEIYVSPTPNLSVFLTEKEAKKLCNKKILNLEKRIACPAENGECLEIREDEIGVVDEMIPNIENGLYTIKVKWKIMGNEYFTFLGKDKSYSLISN